MAHRLIEVIDRLRANRTEKEWFEFKRNYSSSKMIGKNLSALANSACVKMQQRAYLIFGIDDSTHDVVGTVFDPYAVKADKSNQDLLIWLSSKLQPAARFESHIIDHPDGKVVVFEIFPAKYQPIDFDGTAYIRVGSSTTELAKHPEMERIIWTKGYDWSGEICEGASLSDLDTEALEYARREFSARQKNFVKDLENWSAETLLSKLKLMRDDKLTNAAVVLLGHSEAAGLLSPAEARISWVLRGERNEDNDYKHIEPPFLLAGNKLLERIRDLKVRILSEGNISPIELPRYDPWVLREALHNCIAHQDYPQGGRVWVIEHPDRIKFTNVGDFLPGDIETVIYRDAPYPIYRNGLLAESMTDLGMMDSRGGGIKQMFSTQQERAFPLPDYNLEESERVHVTIYGSVLDLQYTQLLLKRTDFDLNTAILLDKVQKRLPISKEEHKRLKGEGLVEGRYPNLLVAGPVSRAVGEAGRHIRDRGFDQKYYRDLILDLLEEHGPVSRSWINDALVPKLPDRLSEEQKLTQVHNLIQWLRRAGLIVNLGTSRSPAWVPSHKAEDSSLDK